MKIILLTSISNIEPIDRDLKFNEFTFTSDKSKIDKIISDKGVEKSIGTIELEKLKSGCYLFCETEFKANSDEVISDDEIGILKDNITLYHGILDSYISFLWFRKDNCCSLNSLYLYLPSCKRIIQRKASPVFSNSKGIENCSIKFTEEDLQAIGLMFIKSTSLFYHKNIKPKTISDNQQEMFIERKLIPYDFKKQTRIERAFQFLLLARKSNQLPLKISFYICIYETLFYGVTNGEISHQIAERVALYISNSRMFRTSIYKQIKDAYKIRSIYFHGNSFLKFNKDLNQISFYLDNLTRQVLYSIFAKDSKIFLQTDELLEKSFLDMIFEDERKPDGLTVESGLEHLRFRD